MQVMIEEAKNQSNGTNIDLGGQKRTSSEFELFEVSRRLNLDLEEISEDRAEKYEVINVISNFQSVGQEVKGVTKNYGFLLSFFSASIMILFLLLRRLNKYLDNYKK